MKQIALAEVATINPPSPVKGELRNNELVDFVPMASVSEAGDMNVTEQRAAGEVSKGFTAFQNDDVLVAKITPCFENNKIAIARIGSRYGFGSTEFHVIRCSSAYLDPKYLAHFLRQDRVRATGEKRMTGSGGQRRVPKAFLEALEIPLPPLDEQKRIAAILDQADNLRRLRQRAIDRLNELGQAIFYEMFGDGEHFERKCVKDFCEVKGGKRLPKGSDYSEEKTKHPYIRVSDLSQGTISQEGLKFIAPEVQHTVRRYIVDEGDVIISIAGTIGVTAPVPKSLDGANLTENAAKLTPVKGACFDANYVSYALSMPDAQKQIQSKTGQVTIGKLALFRIEQIEIPLPSIGEQKKFSKALARIGMEISNAGHHRHHLDRLFSSLQHRAFTGQL